MFQHKGETMLFDGKTFIQYFLNSEGKKNHKQTLFFSLLCNLFFQFVAWKKKMWYQLIQREKIKKGKRKQKIVWKEICFILEAPHQKTSRK